MIEAKSQDDLLNAEKDEGATLVYYTAEWCSPCKRLSPIVQEIADSYRGKMSVVTVDIDKVAPTVAILSVPQLYLYKDGQFVSEVSTTSKSGILDLLESAL